MLGRAASSIHTRPGDTSDHAQQLGAMPSALDTLSDGGASGSGSMLSPLRLFTMSTGEAPPEGAQKVDCSTAANFDESHSNRKPAPAGEPGVPTPSFEDASSLETAFNGVPNLLDLFHFWSTEHN